MSSEKTVFDSYAVIAYFENEVGAKKVEELLWQAELGKRLLLMSIINWGEVYLEIQNLRIWKGKSVLAGSNLSNNP